MSILGQAMPSWSERLKTKRFRPEAELSIFACWVQSFQPQWSKISSLAAHLIALIFLSAGVLAEVRFWYFQFRKDLQSSQMTISSFRIISRLRLLWIHNCRIPISLRCHQNLLTHRDREKPSCCYIWGIQDDPNQCRYPKDNQLRSLMLSSPSFK